MKNTIPPFLLDRPSSLPQQSIPRGGLSAPFIDRAIGHISGIIKSSYVQWDLASRNGLFQRLDPRVKVFFLIFFIVIVSIKESTLPELCIAAMLFACVALSRISLLAFYRRVLVIGFFFGFLIALPSALNIFSGGDVIVPLLRFSGERQFLIYRIPATVGFTMEGLTGLLLLTLRVLNSLTLTFLLLFTTPFTDIIKALKTYRVPDTVLLIITLTYKYMLTFARTIEDIHLAKKSRMAGSVSGAEMRRWLAGRMAFLFRKSQMRFEEVYKAMQGRGFSGTIEVYAFRKLSSLDWVAGLLFLSSGIILIIL